LQRFGTPFVLAYFPLSPAESRRVRARLARTLARTHEEAQAVLAALALLAGGRRLNAAFALAEFQVVG
jgi:hypothetical protein